MKVEFKVAMDNEQKLAGNVQTVTLEVEKCGDELMLKYALKAYTVEMQSAIRNHWDEFTKGDYPKSVVIGQALFGSTRGVVTAEKAKAAYKDSMASMSMLEKLKALYKDGMIGEELFEASITTLFEKDEITEEEMDEALIN